MILTPYTIKLQHGTNRYSVDWEIVERIGSGYEKESTLEGFSDASGCVPDL